MNFSSFYKFSPVLQFHDLAILQFNRKVRKGFRKVHKEIFRACASL
jgi:hypothetical protein